VSARKEEERRTVCPVEGTVCARWEDIDALSAYQVRIYGPIFINLVFEHVDVLSRHHQHLANVLRTGNGTYRRMLLHNVNNLVRSSAELTRPYVPRPVVGTFGDRFTA
jgi:hypothetical protein